MHTAYESTNEANVPSYLKGEFFKSLPAEALAELEHLLAPSNYPSGMVLFCASPRQAKCWAFPPRSLAGHMK